MKTEYLVLPFYDNIKKTSLYDNAFYNVAPNVSFRVFCPYNELLPFIAPYAGVNCNFTLQVRDYFGNLYAEIPRTNIKHKIIQKGSEKFIKFEGGVVDCLDLGGCNLPYTIQIGNFFSEWFWVGNTDNLTKFEIGNSQDFLSVPYRLGFKQWFWLDTNFGTSEIETFRTTVRDERGNTQTKFERLTEVFNFFLISVPAHMKQVFASMEVLDEVRVINGEQEVYCIEKQATSKSKRADSNFASYDIELAIPSSKINEFSYCEDPIFAISTDCNGVDSTQPNNCISINKITGIDVDCFDINDIENIDVCCFDEIDFFATVTYK